MALIKCTECGHEVSDNASICTNCGCPANDFTSQIVCDLDEVKKTDVKQEALKKNVQTTDTEYKYENLIQGYATFLFSILIIAGVILWLAAIMMTSMEGGVGGFVVGFFGGGILFLAFMGMAYVVRAFLMVYANISINLHEINLKHQ